VIKRLTFSVTFPTGRSFTADHDFHLGLTAISAPNEQGKSLRLEFIRFALFGTDALRGAATDYKTLKVTLDFQVKGQDYAVFRNGSKVELKQGDVTVASGIKAVNAKIIDLLGYDLTVFDTANSCNQGEIEALGAMKPAQRKAMVDQTIGLNPLDDVGKLVSEKLSMERDRAKFDGVEPVAPVKPDGYTPSGDLRITIKQLETEVSELNQLRGWLKAPAPAEPTLPTCSIAETVEELQAHQAERQRITVLKSQLHSLRKPTHTKQQIEALSRQLKFWNLWVEKKALPVPPQYTAEQLDEMEVTWTSIEGYKELQLLLTKLEKAKAHGTNKCPACEHVWPLLADEVDRLEKLIWNYGPQFQTLPAAPALTRAEATVAREALAREQALAPQRLRLKDVMETADPGVREGDLERARLALDDGARYAELSALVVPVDRTKDLQDRQKHDWNVAAYQQQKADYDRYTAERAAKQALHDSLLPSEAKYAAANKQLLESLGYEGAQQRYEFDATEYQRVKAIADHHAHRADQYERAREAIKELKVRVKQYLVPSLSSAASQLLSQMTNGKRSRIEISEEFDIKVDGQPLQTLSGSGKAAANLAVRIGLGQVLTNKVFSVFMGDEIDAAMDAERAGFTAECLRGLTQTIKQVVLVSHKEHEADHQIRVAA
jgi:DNA repair exonuclease SbcCD ATPase subunit